jgi:hypothetical protein
MSYTELDRYLLDEVDALPELAWPPGDAPTPRIGVHESSLAMIALSYW